MPHLEVRSPDGRSEVRKLSRRNPIVIGRNPVSDIHVDDDNVGAIHCRVSWNGKSYEVASVTGDGVEVNGTLVRKKTLSTGDVIRVGELDLVILNGSGEIKRAPAVAAATSRGPAAFDDLEESTEVADLADDDWEALSAGEIESPIEKPTMAPRSKRPRDDRSSRSQPAKGDEPDDVPVLLDEAAATLPAGSAVAAPAPKDSADSKERVTAGKKSWGVLKPAKRPGEQDILTSPLVLGFGGLALALLLAAGAIWLLIGREGADRLYAAAVDDRQAGRYAQAIGGYEQFLLEYPTDSRAMEAKYALGLTRIERFAGGSAPDYGKALKEVENFVRDNRDSAEFDTQREPLRILARRIASGAASTAIRTGDRQLLAPAEAGQTLFERYAPADGTAEPIKAELRKQYAAAETAVRKREYFDVAAAKIEAAIKANEFATAFEARTDLLTRYPDLRNDRRVRALLASTLSAEQTLIHSADLPVQDEAPTTAEAMPTPVTFIGHTQARAGEVSDGRLVHAVGRDALLGLDAVTGRPVWRSPIGLDTPFPPVAVSASVPALLTFDASRNELRLLKQEDGTLLWRTATGARANGAPLISQGQIDIATSDGQLRRYDLETGRPLAAVQFPQNIVGTPVLAGERLIAFGERATAFTLNFRSLEVEATSFVGHAAGGIVAPPLGLGRLIVIFDNDRVKSSVVRAFSIDEANGQLQQVAAERIDGVVREPAVARGNVLFVPASLERVFSFSVSDEAGQPPLTRLASIQIPDAKDVPTYVVPGPDGMLWAAGSALRKLRLVAAGLELLPGSLAPGRHTQPPQQSGESLFVARSLPSAPAVYVSQADREAMTGSWRTVIGSDVVGLAVEGAEATFVTSAGQAAGLSEADLDRGGFLDMRPLPQWDENSAAPLAGMTTIGSESLVWRDGSPPLSWRFSAGGLPANPLPLPGVPQCEPVRLEGGVVLPLAGKLEWFPASAGSKVDPFLLPVGGDNADAPRWQSLVAIDDDGFVAVDDQGTLRVIRLRQEPLPHLNEAATITLDASLVRAPVARDGRIVIVEGSAVRLLDPAGLRTIAEATFEGPLAGGPWVVGDDVYVQTSTHRLVRLAGEMLEQSWGIDLAAPLAGTPRQADNQLVAALQSGYVVTIDGEGQEVARADLQAPLTMLLAIGSRLAAVGLDGSIHPVPGQSSAASQPAEATE